MSITYESAHSRYVRAREEYFRLESELAIARANLNNAERDCSVEWRKVLESAEQRRAHIVEAPEETLTGNLTKEIAPEIAYVGCWNLDCIEGCDPARGHCQRLESATISFNCNWAPEGCDCTDYCKRRSLALSSQQRETP